MVAERVARRGDCRAVGWTITEGTSQRRRTRLSGAGVAERATSAGRPRAPGSRGRRDPTGEARARGSCPFELSALIRQGAELPCGGALLGKLRVIKCRKLHAAAMELLERRHGPWEAVAARQGGQSGLAGKRAGRRG